MEHDRIGCLYRKIYLGKISIYSDYLKFVIAMITYDFKNDFFMNTNGNFDG